MEENDLLSDVFGPEMISKPKVVFFCGHQSPYGLAHLEPIINNFDVKVVILATDERWEAFRQRLNEEDYYKNRDTSLKGMLKSILQKLLPGKIAGLVIKSIGREQVLYKILQQHNIECWQVFDVNSSDFQLKLKEKDGDLFLSAAYPQIVKRTLIDIPRLGMINFHPSLLPRYRGAHPHFWQIVRGEKTGGITAHFMTEQIDAGDIVAQIPIEINDCTYSELYDKIISHTPEIVKLVSQFFSNESSKARPQNASESSVFRNNREIHSRILWNTQTLEEIKNLIRTQSAFCFFRGEKLFLYSANLSETIKNLPDGIGVEPGTIVSFQKDSISIESVDGIISVKEISKKNLRHLSAFEWAKRKKVLVGEMFT